MKNAFTDFDFLLRPAQNCMKCTFLDNLRTITQKGNMDTRQMILFFHLLFPLELFVTFIFVFENSQKSFSCDPLFRPFWSVKWLNFSQKLPFRTAHHTFLESRHPEVTKNPYYVLSPKGSQKKESAHGLFLKSRNCWEKMEKNPNILISNTNRNLLDFISYGSRITLYSTTTPSRVPFTFVWHMISPTFQVICKFANQYLLGRKCFFSDRKKSW